MSVSDTCRRWWRKCAVTSVQPGCLLAYLLHKREETGKMQTVRELSTVIMRRDMQSHPVDTSAFLFEYVFDSIRYISRICSSDSGFPHQNDHNFSMAAPNVWNSLLIDICNTGCLSLCLLFVTNWKYSFYRAMHFSAKRGIAIVICCPSVCLSVCPSVCDVQVSWSHRLEFFKK